MKYYLAGPMRRIPYFNFPAFRAARAELRAAGHDVFCPAENAIKTYGRDFSVDHPDGDESKLKGFNRRAAISADLAWICAEAEGIALLPGWERSSGARAEFAVAEALGLKVSELPVEGPL